MCPDQPPLTQPPHPSDSHPEADEEQPIAVQVDEAYEALVNPLDVARAVAAALVAEGVPDGELTVVVTGDDEVRALNRQFRGLDEPTDVLSFPAQDETPGFVSAPTAARYLGDVVIALPYTERQADSLGRPLRDELRLLAVHGTLHLLGYDHAEAEEEVRMWAQQQAILDSLER